MQWMKVGWSRLARLAAGIAILTVFIPTVTPAFADGVIPPTPVVVPKRCFFSGRTPAPGTTVHTRDVFIAVNIRCNKPVGRVAVFLDGVRRTTEGLGKDEFHSSEFFTALNLANGRHRVQVFVAGNGSTSWHFFVRN